MEGKGSIHKAGKENRGRGRPLAHAWSLDDSFRPKITRRAQRKKARSVEELHEGGRLQRERTLVLCPLQLPLSGQGMCAEPRHFIARESIFAARKNPWSVGHCCLLQEQLRLERTAAEEAQMTFAPSINHCYSVSSRPLLDLAYPDPYLAHAESQRRRLEASRQQAAEERKVRGSCAQS